MNQSFKRRLEKCENHINVRVLGAPHAIVVSHNLEDEVYTILSGKGQGDVYHSEQDLREAYPKPAVLIIAPVPVQVSEGK